MTHRRKLIAGAATAALLTTTAALAAPNRETTLTPGGNGFAWDGGPLSGAAATSDIPLPCGPGKECDDTLIRAPQRGQLIVSIDGPDPESPPPPPDPVPDPGPPPGTDLDLYLFEADEQGEPGDLLASSTTPTADEKVSQVVKGGTYLVRVVAALANGAEYVGQAQQAVVPSLDFDDAPPDFGPDPAPPPASAESGATSGQPGTRTIEPATNAAPFTVVARPSATSRRLAGRAKDLDGSVQYVDVGLIRLGKENRCRGLTPSGKFRRIRKCTAPAWVRAKGRESWSVRLRRALKPGRYVLYGRATDATGLAEGGFGQTNKVAFRIRRR